MDTDDNETLLGGFAVSLAASWDRRGAQFVNDPCNKNYRPRGSGGLEFDAEQRRLVRSQAVRPAVLDGSQEGLARVLGSA